MSTRYLVLGRRIERELEDVRRSAEKARLAFDRARRHGGSATFYLDSAAVNLHAFYSGVERILEEIAREIDGGAPAGPNWHRDLLRQMALDIPGLRPPVLAESTAAQLEIYLRFRHLVRNLYTWNFDPGKLADLVANLGQLLAALENDLALFGEFLQAASMADSQTGD